MAKNILFKKSSIIRNKIILTKTIEITTITMIQVFYFLKLIKRTFDTTINRLILRIIQQNKSIWNRAMIPGIGSKTNFISLLRDPQD